MDLSNKEMRAFAALTSEQRREMRTAGNIQYLNEEGQWDFYGELAFPEDMVFRVRPAEEYDWLRNPEKRNLEDAPDTARHHYCTAWRQGLLEYWSEGHGRWSRVGLFSDGPRLAPDDAFRLATVDTSNPDWIVWGKMDKETQEAIAEQPQRVQVLWGDGTWLAKTSDVFLIGQVYRLRP